MSTRESYLKLLVAVIIPFLQAIITGLLIGSIAIAGLYLIQKSVLYIPSLLVAALSAALYWLNFMKWWKDLLIIDPNDSQVVPEPEQEGIRVELVENGGKQVRFIDLPCKPNQLQAIANGLNGGASFTEAVWCGSNGIFTRSEFVTLRDTLLKRGLISQNSLATSQRGYNLTRGGIAAVRYLSTTPLLENDSNNG